MKISNNENQFVFLAATFYLIGGALLLSVIIWHQQINQHPLFRKGAVAVAAETKAVTVEQPVSSRAVPEEVLKEITEDPRNLTGYVRPTETVLSPALQFLYTLESPNIFPSQQ